MGGRVLDGSCLQKKRRGGSRAYAFTGNYLAEDPNCIYQPHLAEAIAG
jgi:MoaA/NifB/PqqE/SkfB family radical SAM enzyme